MLVASPQMHGLITAVILTAILAFQKSISFLDILAGLIFGVLIDLDHFDSLEYIKDVFQRIKESRGEPALGIKMPKCWLHRWPGVMLMMISTLIMAGVAWRYDLHFMWYLPAIFLTVHLVIDRFERGNSRKVGRISYPKKSPKEFRIAHSALIVVIICLSGFYLAREWNVATFILIITSSWMVLTVWMIFDKKVWFQSEASLNKLFIIDSVILTMVVFGLLTWISLK